MSSDRYSCGVANCPYESSTTIEGFPVCELHNAPQTRGILDKLERPGAFLMGGHLIVVPVGALEEEHFFQTGGKPIDLDRLTRDTDLDGPGAAPQFDLFKEYPEIL
ncbi:MAG: hypothetical protein Q8S00_32435 [Deltaproteobacteria bacterium]|nr:hypothetical protein [Deltaproteobacteria bacterium]